MRAGDIQSEFMSDFVYLRHRFRLRAFLLRLTQSVRAFFQHSLFLFLC